MESFIEYRKTLTTADKRTRKLDTTRLILAGGYDPRLQDNVQTLQSLVDLAASSKVPYQIMTTEPDKLAVTEPKGSSTYIANADLIFLLNFTTSQRSALLQSPSALALLYTPKNEHFGIGPVEAMASGLPILACDSGGPKETIVSEPPKERTGWLRPPNVASWSEAMREIARLERKERNEIAARAKTRVNENFTLDIMAQGLEQGILEACQKGRVGLWEILDFDLEVTLMVVSLTFLCFSIWWGVMDKTAALMMLSTFLARKMMPMGQSFPNGVPEEPIWKRQGGSALR